MKRTPIIGCALALGLAAVEADAVGTRSFLLDTLDSLSGGDLTGVAVGSDGTVRAGFSLSKLPIQDATSVLDAVVLPDGAVLLGTGSGGRIYRVKAGQAAIAATTGMMAVSTLVVGFDGLVLAGTPEGKIFKYDPKQKDGQALQPWVTLPGAEDVVEDLCFDAKNKALYASTGPEGKLYRIDAAGKTQVYFDSDEPHLVSCAVAGDGTVLTGSSGKALLYRVTGPGRATVLQDFEGDDVLRIAIVPAGIPHAGEIYVLNNDYKGALRSFRPLRRAKLQADNMESHDMRAGRGKLWRFGPTGIAELLFDDGDSHLVSIALDDNGLPTVGTGEGGKVYTVDDNHTTRLLADKQERVVAALSVTGKARFIASADPVVFHEITGVGGPNAVWTSKVLDAGLRAHFGVLDWTAEGAIELQTRSGNTDKPDAAWSDWGPALGAPGDSKTPAGRFVQARARWSRDPKAVLRSVRLSFITDNARAVITDVGVGDEKAETGGASVPASGGPPSEEQPSPKLRVHWKVDNPDNDQLRFRLYFRPASQPRWTALLADSEVLTKSDYTWETAGLPEGRYRLRVDATDELANPPGSETKHSLESAAFLVDNTPPVISNLALKGNRLSGTVSDAIGPISRIEVALIGGKPFYPILPKDGIYDKATETFDVDVGGIIPPGPQVVVVVRAYDAAGNRTSANATR